MLRNRWSAQIELLRQGARLAGTVYEELEQTSANRVRQRREQEVNIHDPKYTSEVTDMSGIPDTMLT